MSTSRQRHHSPWWCPWSLDQWPSLSWLASMGLREDHEASHDLLSSQWVVVIAVVPQAITRPKDFGCHQPKETSRTTSHSVVKTTGCECGRGLEAELGQGWEALALGKDFATLAFAFALAILYQSIDDLLNYKDYYVP
uniref:Uncharacterized protein n=1 Tax=Solanum tuberosum TaxID=4113 RepID=M1DG45_SOLTU